MRAVAAVVFAAALGTVLRIECLLARQVLQEGQRQSVPSAARLTATASDC